MDLNKLHPLFDFWIANYLPLKKICPLLWKKWNGIETASVFIIVKDSKGCSDTFIHFVAENHRKRSSPSNVGSLIEITQVHSVNRARRAVKNIQVKRIICSIEA
ncbi:hypothetical protein Y1Q_0009608 [Alligator mississippiensis]|uniref:Uncharacterized protein n=1 Tax=Alligator mississippiensis TaxID=8496 RepID=A0A151NV26_ALLMI|nr:hypothetical protein Y1Q_0009608 [Alligator mississippiensis]